MGVRLLVLFLTSWLHLSESLTLSMEGGETSFDLPVGYISEIKFYVHEANQTPESLRIYVSHKATESKVFISKCSLERSERKNCSSNAEICRCLGTTADGSAFSLQKTYLANDSGSWKFSIWNHQKTEKTIIINIVDPPKITDLTVNGKKADTHITDPGQEVNISCFFINGNSKLGVRLVNDSGHILGSSTQRQGPLVAPLRRLSCDNIWPTITCTALNSSRSVSILVKCLPKLSSSSTQFDLAKAVNDGLMFRLKSYTRNITGCMMTKLPRPSPPLATTCELAGSGPEFNLTLGFFKNVEIGKGNWTLTVQSELGNSNVTFELISNIPQSENQKHLILSGSILSAFAFIAALILLFLLKLARRQKRGPWREARV